VLAYLAEIECDVVTKRVDVSEAYLYFLVDALNTTIPAFHNQLAVRLLRTTAHLRDRQVCVCVCMYEGVRLRACL
jgi:hypothetical protein